MSLKNRDFGLFSSSTGGGGGGTGTVTSVNAVSCTPTTLCVTGGPINSAGTFCICNLAPYIGQAVEVLGGGTCSTYRCCVNNLSAGAYSAALGGQCNSASGACSVAVGGSLNCATGAWSFSGGGFTNRAVGDCSGIIAGHNNCAIGTHTFIGAGECNQACSPHSVISGGLCNCTTAVRSSVLGGKLNTASGCYSTLSGGYCNTTSGYAAFVGGGKINLSQGCYATINGGKSNTASSNYSLIGGGFLNVVATANSSVVGGNCNCVCAGVNSTILGGLCNFANDTAGYSALLGGFRNCSCGAGQVNLVFGQCNITSNCWSTVLNGFRNCATGCQSSVLSGGRDNLSSGWLSSVVGGSTNIACCVNSSILNGNKGCATANFSQILNGGFHSNSVQQGLIGNGSYNYLCNSAGADCAFGATIINGIGNNTTGGTFLIGCNSGAGCFCVAPTICNVGCFSFIGNGFQNRTQSAYSSVINGLCNVANGCFSFIGAGCSNTVASGNIGSTIVSGCCNTISGTYTYNFIGGGILNTINCIGAGAFIGGGLQNCVGGNYGVVAGGRLNTISCYASGLSGIFSGFNNKVLGAGSVILGGYCNCTCSNYSSVFGSKNCATNIMQSISAGCLNVSCGCFSSIVNGCCNKTCARWSTIGNGFCNCSIGVADYSFVSGYGNVVSGCFSSAIGCGLTASSACTLYTNNTCATDYLYTGCIPNGCVVCSNNGQLVGFTYPSSSNYGLFAQTSNSTTITATTSEGTLIDGGVGTLSVPANGFKVGDSFYVNMGGIMSAKNNDTITIRNRTATALLADSGGLTLPGIVNQVWTVTIVFTIRTIGAAGVASIVTTGQFHVLKLASGTQEGYGWNTINNTTFDTTIPNTLDITAQWSSTSALNSIYSDAFVLNKIY